MSKQEIDHLFAKKYDYLLSSIKKTKLKHGPKRDFECEELLSYAYEHLLERKNKINDEKNFDAFFNRYIYTSIKWENSTINLEKKDDKMIYPEVLFDGREDDFDGDLDFKIKLDIDYQNKKAILFQFRTQLPTKQEKILFDVIFVKHITTVSAIHKHYKNCGIKMCESYVREDKKKLMTDLEEFLDEKQYKIN